MKIEMSIKAATVAKDLDQGIEAKIEEGIVERGGSIHAVKREEGLEARKEKGERTLQEKMQKKRVCCKIINLAKYRLRVKLEKKRKAFY